MFGHSVHAWYSRELTQPRTGGEEGGGGLGPCRATVPPHRVYRVTRGHRCVVLCCLVLCYRTMMLASVLQFA